MTLKRRLINIVKYNKVIYWFYSHLGVLAINILKIFVKQEPQSVMFVSFGGKRLDDSPKAIYDAMLKDSRFDNYKLYWGVMNPKQYSVQRGELITIDTIGFYKKLLSSQVWITNSSVNRGLPFQVDGVLYINTWHGIPIKCVGADTPEHTKAFGLKKDSTNYYYASSDFDNQIYHNAFSWPKEKILNYGLPRNDELYLMKGKEKQIEMKIKLGIGTNKKVILYAPTFREYILDGNNNVVLLPPMDLNKWEKELGDDYVMLFRAHYEVSKSMEIKESSFLKDMSSYPVLNELMLAADILLSDYSSIYFDFSILEKPMLCFCYDYEEYSTKRGTYIDIRKELNSYSSTEDEVIAEIVNIDEKERQAISSRFFHKYLPAQGGSCQKTLDLIVDNTK